MHAVFRPTALILLALGVISLPGCTPTVIDTACQSFAPITYSAGRDTPDTVLQVRRHNAAYDAICR